MVHPWLVSVALATPQNCWEALKPLATAAGETRVWHRATHGGDNAADSVVVVSVGRSCPMTAGISAGQGWVISSSIPWGARPAAAFGSNRSGRTPRMLFNDYVAVGSGFLPGA